MTPPNTVATSSGPTSIGPSARDPEDIVRIAGVNHDFGDEEHPMPVLFDVDLHLAPGELVILTGPSGSGKTTLLTLIGALRSVQRGSLRGLGQDLRDLGGSAGIG